VLRHPVHECDRIFVERLRAFVISGLSDPGFNVPRLALNVCMSSRQLQRRCRELTGQGPLEFIRSIRLEEAEAMVRRGAFRTVAEVAAAVGMSPTYLARLYSAWQGHPPSEDLRA